MATDLADWKKITPPELVPAIKHIRDTFDTTEWKCSQVTGKLCYSALHPQAADRVALAPYEEAFVVYRRIVGPLAQREFDDLLRTGTPPAIFKAYLNAFRNGLQTEVRRLFNEALQIGLANAKVLKTHPVEWATAHLKILIREQLPLVVGWIKEVCDEQNSAKVFETEEDLEELVFWKTWRAPTLVYMQPSGNATYDPAGAWAREDEQRTQQLLRALSDRFIQFLEIDLDKTAGAAYVECAKRGKLKAQANQNPSPPEDSQGTGESEQRASHSSNQEQSHEKTRLGPKKQDLSRYLDSADLTARQRECISLRLEYGLRKTAIAQRLGINRKTLDEHISAAERKFEVQTAKDRAAKNLGKVKPGDTRTR
jgi:DNA-binding CsgD family transcriptional regulator